MHKTVTTHQPRHAANEEALQPRRRMPHVIRALGQRATAAVRPNRRSEPVPPLPLNLFEAERSTHDEPGTIELNELEPKTAFSVKRPRATARQVSRATGLDLGPLVRTIQLPASRTESSNQASAARDSARRILLFNIGEGSYSQQQNAVPELIGLSMQDLNKLRESMLAEGNSDSTISAERIAALGINALHVKADGEAKYIGRLHWMPIAQDGERSTQRAGLPNIYSSVGNTHASISMDADGMVTVENMSTIGTKVSPSRPETPLVFDNSPVDPYFSGEDPNSTEPIFLSGPAAHHIPYQHDDSADTLRAAEDPWLDVSGTERISHR